MQNQTPEIQAKLLAMQRMMQQQKPSSGGGITLDSLQNSLVVSSTPVTTAVTPQTTEKPKSVLSLDTPVPKPKPTPEEKEEQSRYYISCCY